MLTCRAILNLSASILPIVLASNVLADDPPQSRALENAGYQVVWQSRHTNPNALADSLETLYLSLYNAGTLTVRTIPADQQNKSTMLEVLSKHNVIIGDHYTVGMDSMLCDLNPHVCKRNRVAESSLSTKSASEHVGGLKKSKAVWSELSNKALVLPDIELDMDVLFTNRPVASIKQLEAIVENLNVDCSVLDISCLDLVRGLNTSLYDPNRKERTLNKGEFRTATVPINSYSSKLILGDASQSDFVLSENKYLFERSVSSVSVNSIEAFHDSWKKQLEKRGSLTIAIESLQSNIVAPNAIQPQSNHDATAPMAHRQLLELIHHPLARSATLPAHLQHPVQIAVLDFAFDENHCDLAGAVTVDLDLWRGALTHSIRPRAGTCGQVLEEGIVPAQEHGTHIAGLIAARANDKGITGLNPHAKVTYIAVDGTVTGSPEYRKKLSNKLLMMSIAPPADERIQVANISWKYTNNGFLDPIRNQIQALKERTLFVVAAGNGRLKMSHDEGCFEFPACYHGMNNVMTIVGIDRSDPPKRWVEGEDVGSNINPSFSLAAVADGVVSTIQGDHIKAISGTSQAVPQVVAAASLIHSRFQTQFAVSQPVLLPIRIKNRLIYTSDLSNSVGPLAMGGRLNVKIALDMASDHIRIATPQGEVSYVGKVLDFDENNRGQDFIQCRRSNGSTFAVQFQDLRRMYYDEIRRKYVLFYNSVPGDRDSELFRESNCGLDTINNLATMEVDGEHQDVTFKLRQIRDYVSAMY